MGFRDYLCVELPDSTTFISCVTEQLFQLCLSIFISRIKTLCLRSVQNIQCSIAYNSKKKKKRGAIECLVSIMNILWNVAGKINEQETSISRNMHKNKVKQNFSSV